MSQYRLSQECTNSLDFDAGLNGRWPGAGIPVRLPTIDGSIITALLDLPEQPEGELIPVLLTMLFGRTKEDLGAITESLIAQKRFAVFRPAFLNSGDEAPGQLPDLVLGGDEIAWWGGFLKSDRFRNLCEQIRPGTRISTRTACISASISAPQALEAQVSGGIFDAMMFLSFIPDVKDFLARKTGKAFDEWLALEWRYRLKTASNPAAIRKEVETYSPSPGASPEDVHRYNRILRALDTADEAALSDFNVVVEGVPSNLRKAFSGSLSGLWEYHWGLEQMIQRAQRIPLPLTFITGGRDNYYPPERMEEFIVRSRERGLRRRHIQIGEADHLMRPYSCFEQAMKGGLEALFEDLGMDSTPAPFSTSRITLRRYYETRGFALRHSGTLGLPPELVQKFLLRKEDIRNALDSLLSRPLEVAEYLRLLGHSRTLHGGHSIVDQLEPDRLYHILNSALRPGHHSSIAEGLSLEPEMAGGLLNSAAVRILDLEHIEGILQELTRWPDAVIRFLKSVEPEILEQLGQRKAFHQAKRAAGQVPAYRDFIQNLQAADTSTSGSHPPSVLKDFPITSRKTFVDTYPIESRCIGGVLPADGVMDESGGTSGRPTDWVRCRAEEDRLAGGLVAMYRYLFRDGDEHTPTVFLNGFSQGAWSTSTKLAVLSRYSTLSKNIGTDTGKILGNIERLGPAYTYHIAGYPPFLRELVRCGTERHGFCWSHYRVHVLHGGEGYTSSWLSYMRRHLGRLSRIVSAYGASDLDLGIAYETQAAQEIRDRLEKLPDLRKQILNDLREPVFFGQYNPSEFYLEERVVIDGRRSIVGTVTNPLSQQPRVRYDIGDDGVLIPFHRMATLLEHAGQPPLLNDVLHLPFIALFGRIDGTLSLDGANVSPSEVEQGIYSHPEIARLVRSFRMRRAEQPDGSVRFEVALETHRLVSPQEEIGLASMASQALTDHLSTVNPDYRESVTHNPGSAVPKVHFVEPGTLVSRDSIKNHYME